MSVTTTAAIDPVVDQLEENESVDQLKQKTVSGAASYMARSLVLYGISMAASLVLGAYLSVDHWAFNVFL
jgi:PBP1b-binding outer membrane lipoprotein LpoB